MLDHRKEDRFRGIRDRPRGRQRKILRPRHGKLKYPSHGSISPPRVHPATHPPLAVHHFCLRRDKILREQQIPRAFAVAIPAGPKTGVGERRKADRAEPWKRKPRTRREGVRVARFHVFNHFARSQWHGTGIEAAGRSREMFPAVFYPRSSVPELYLGR